MKNKLKRQCRVFVLLQVVMITFAAACSEFIEPSIAEDEVRLLAPSAGAVTSSQDMVFVWEPLAHAISYRFQVASPSFAEAVFFVSDTVLSRTSIRLEVAPGAYEWWVAAANGSSHTQYATHAFTIRDTGEANVTEITNIAAER